MKKALVGLFVAMFCTASHAQFINGNKLNEWLAAEDRLENGGKNHLDYTLSASGIYYITGAVEALSGMGLLCLPDGVTLGQMRAVVSKYMRDNPEKWNTNASVLVYVAISKAFPCKK